MSDSKYQIKPQAGKLKVQIDTGVKLNKGNVKINQIATTRGEAIDKLQRYLEDNPDVAFDYYNSQE
ncbi:MAG: hypothetical protein AAF152_08345 [Cyanobacteria bacterium P01_A01_bin.114]